MQDHSAAVTKDRGDWLKWTNCRATEGATQSLQLPVMAYGQTPGREIIAETGRIQTGNRK
jgi:hypothetical protein